MRQRGRTFSPLAVAVVIVLIAAAMLYSMQPAADEQHTMREAFRAQGEQTADQLHFGADSVNSVFGGSRLVGLFDDGGGRPFKPGEPGPLPGPVEPPDRVVLSDSGLALGRVVVGDPAERLAARVRHDPRQGHPLDGGDREEGDVLHFGRREHGHRGGIRVPHASDPPRVSFFDEQGARVRRITVPGLQRAYLSGNGDRVALRTNGSVTVHDATGQVRYATPVSGECFFSEDGETLVVLHPDAAVVYRGGSEVARATTDGAPVRAALTPDGSHVAVVDSKHLYVVDVVAGTTSPSRVTLANDRFRSVAISRKGQRVLAGSLLIRQRATESQEGRARASVWSFDAAGQQLAPQQRFVTRMWGQIDPEVRFLDDEGRQSVVRTRERVLLLDLPQ